MPIRQTRDRFPAEDPVQVGARQPLRDHVSPPASRFSLFDARSPSFRYNFPGKSSGLFREPTGSFVLEGSHCPKRPNLLGSLPIGAHDRRPDPSAAGRRAKHGGAGFHGRIPEHGRIPSAIGFIGDLDDPWIAAIADARRRPARSIASNCAGALPDRPFGEAAPPRAIIIQRHNLSLPDARRTEDWRARAGEPRAVLILCISPYVRYEELERSSGLFDAIISEATAADVLPGRLARRAGWTPTAPTGGECPGLPRRGGRR